jgi:hypothetical protein
MTTTSERTMTPDGQIANPLDKAANREPFLNVLEGLLCRNQPFQKQAILVKNSNFEAT